MKSDDPNLTDPICIDHDSAERLHEQINVLRYTLIGKPSAANIEAARETLDYMAEMLRVGVATYDGDTSGKALVDDANTWRRLVEELKERRRQVEEWHLREAEEIKARRGEVRHG